MSMILNNIKNNLHKAQNQQTQQADKNKKNKNLK